VIPTQVANFAELVAFVFMALQALVAVLEVGRLKVASDNVVVDRRAEALGTEVTRRETFPDGVRSLSNAVHILMAGRIDTDRVRILSAGIR